MPDAIRKLPGVEQRVETGPVQFGDDWPGIFIRGDNALWLCQCIDATLLALKAKPPEDGADWIAVAGLQGMRNTLAGCDLTGLASRTAGVGLGDGEVLSQDTPMAERSSLGTQDAKGDK